jgi:hypothetical protein
MAHLGVAMLFREAGGMPGSGAPASMEEKSAIAVRSLPVKVSEVSQKFNKKSANLQ